MNKENKQKPTLYLDMDEVIVDMLSPLCIKYNELYNKNLKVSDIKSYNLAKYIGDEGFEIINEPGFFANLQPIEGAIETIKKLIDEDNFSIFIISSPMNGHCAYEKYQWVKEYLPFFNIKNLILVGNKGELLSKIDCSGDCENKVGILFDDCPEYLKKFNGIRVVMDREYNNDLVVGVDCDYRVDEWDEFYEIVNGLKM